MCFSSFNYTLRFGQGLSTLTFISVDPPAPLLQAMGLDLTQISLLAAGNRRPTPIKATD